MAKTIYRACTDLIRCGHDHSTALAASKCMQDTEDAKVRVIASDDGGVSWRVLTGQETESLVTARKTVKKTKKKVSDNGKG